MILHGKSDIGKQRQQNQDSFVLRTLDDDSGYVIVCDGMGGHNGGNIASELAVRTIDETLMESYVDFTEDNIEAKLSATVRHANGVVFSCSLRTEDLKGMGTTVVLAFYKAGKLYVVSVGDSRAYYFDGEKLLQVTKDHSLVQEMLDRGEITDDEAQNHPYKNVITRVLGVTSDVDPDIKVMDFSDEDVLLICSDGLTNMLHEDQIEEILSEYPYADACNELICSANENGGKDNITAALICGDNAI